MKITTLHHLLASGVLLSLVGIPAQSMPTLEGTTTHIQSATLSTNTESDFYVKDGVLDAYLGSGGDVVIPSVVNGEIITRIGETAFQGNETIRSVVIPSTVTEISGGDNYVTQGAFLGCSNLETVSIPNSVTTIQSHVFKLCTSLEYVVIPDSVTYLGSNAFERCYNLSSVKIGNGLTSINANLFAECSALTTVEFGNSITHLGMYAFKDCSSIEELILPNSILAIYSYPFNGCSSLKKIIFPSSFSNVTKDIIYGCDNLEYLVFLNRKTVFEALSLENHKLPTDMSRFYVVGYEGSAAETFAMEKEFNFMSVLDYESKFGSLSSEGTSSSGDAFDISEYSDVSSSDWYYTYVAFALERQLISGSNGLFLPSDPSDRGTIAQALANFSGQAQGFSLPSSYTDVTNYQEGIAWCIERGIMSGYSATTFGTGDPLTREQFSVALMALSKEMDQYTATTTNRLNQFLDGGEISSWAADSFAWAVENGYISGRGGGYLDPKGSVTRAEVATILCSFAENIQAELDKVEQVQRDELAKEEALAKLKAEFAKSTYDKFAPMESEISTTVSSIESQLNSIMSTQFASQTMISVDPAYKNYTSYPKFNPMMDEARLTAGPLFLALEKQLVVANESYGTSKSAGISFDSYENYVKVLTQFADETQVIADFLWDTYEDYYYNAQKQDPAPVMPEMKTTLSSFLDQYSKYQTAYKSLMTEFKSLM